MIFFLKKRYYSKAFSLFSSSFSLQDIWWAVLTRFSRFRARPIPNALCDMPLVHQRDPKKAPPPLKSEALLLIQRQPSCVGSTETAALGLK